MDIILGNDERGSKMRLAAAIGIIIAKLMPMLVVAQTSAPATEDVSIPRDFINPGANLTTTGLIGLLVWMAWKDRSKVFDAIAELKKALKRQVRFNRQQQEFNALVAKALKIDISQAFGAKINERLDELAEGLDDSESEE